MAMMRQMFEFMNTAQRQNQEQMSQMLQQQVLLQQQMLQAHVAAQKPQRKKGNPPQFNGQSNDDLELWLFSTEQYYSNYSEEMEAESSDFVDTIFGNLGPAAQTWYRDFKISLGDQPATWTISKQRIRERFREADFQHKVLSRLHNLRWSGSQQAYTTKFLHLLSQLDCELPEVVKRWYYQQNLRSDTSAFVSQNVPSTLKEVIELAQRFEDSRATIPGPGVQKDQRGDKPQSKPQSQKKNHVASSKPHQSLDTTGRNGDRPSCAYCEKPGHTEAVCFKKKADAKVSTSKNA
ncbi:hypothetical protein PPTG_20024 [Phytophthora nicotianae INRA-310]|uniref:Ty3 transposon capsid-like protein domain-containing protein n=2 Tax=Phytophthora nicotianae TaxID=4792 RepID=W2PB07_PHYN3|nr:hypothetical protein PPTG_20024 [Phytophthora nicotianae INRA-310]ETM97830.1 hypothetical protein PPTG_20024 [Phytophthora nicotianae INRA-310]